MKNIAIGIIATLMICLAIVGVSYINSGVNAINIAPSKTSPLGKLLQTFFVPKAQ